MSRKSIASVPYFGGTEGRLMAVNIVPFLRSHQLCNRLWRWSVRRNKKSF